MARNNIGNLPFNLYVLDTDEALLQSELSKILNTYSSVSLCIRSKTGHTNRGGYYFHVERCNSDNEINLYDINKSLIDTINLTQVTKFINHASGRKYDDEMLKYCQTLINFKQD